VRLPPTSIMKSYSLWSRFVNGHALFSLFLSMASSQKSNVNEDVEDLRMSHFELPSFTCGDATQAKEFNFVSPGYPVSIGLDDLTCSLSIDHGCNEDGLSSSDDNSVCQLRLDFDEFSVQPPLLGNCIFDMFYVGANGKYPLLCGDNSGHHMYLNVEGRASTDLTFILNNLQERLYTCPDKFSVLESTVLDNSNIDIMRADLHHPVVNIGGGGGKNLTMLKFPTRRAWKMKVTQIPCGCGKNQMLRSPDGCLQFHTNISGNVKSLNYNGVGCFSNDPVCDPDNLESCEFVAGYTGQLNNLDYTICIDQEYGFCGTEFYQEIETGSFSLTNKTDLSGNFQEERIEGARNGDSCFSDYLLIPGGHCKNDETHYSTDRFCGNNLGVGGVRQPIISYTKPFNLRVVTDKDEISDSIDYMNRGFHLKYHQMSCNNQSG